MKTHMKKPQGGRAKRNTCLAKNAGDTSPRQIHSQGGRHAKNSQPAATSLAGKSHQVTLATERPGEDGRRMFPEIFTGP